MGGMPVALPCQSICCEDVHNVIAADVDAAGI